MPAEWAPHGRCWMGWPCREEAWGGAMEQARAAYARVARAIAAFEPLTMLAREEHCEEAQRLCGPEVTVQAMALDDSWLRDIGPSFVVNGQGGLAGVDWGFNAWGGEYQGYAQDAQVARRILEHLGLTRYAAPLILEGGSVHVDGEGTVLTTEQCLLNPNRNPNLDRDQIEDHLRNYLGAEQVLWLGEGLVDDETDGHVDNLACFARPGVVLLLSTAEESDANYGLVQDNLRRLRTMTDARGRDLEVVEIEQPRSRVERGVRLGQSYINFYLANGALIMPAFDDTARDANARAILREQFPEREVVQLPALDIVRGGGGIHCITQQQPQV